MAVHRGQGPAAPRQRSELTELLQRRRKVARGVVTELAEQQPAPGVLDYATSKFWILVVAVLLAAAGALLWARRLRRTRTPQKPGSADSPTTELHKHPGGTPE